VGLSETVVRSLFSCVQAIKRTWNNDEEVLTQLYIGLSNKGDLESHDYEGLDDKMTEQDKKYMYCRM
jgi:hypothetical protein